MEPITRSTYGFCQGLAGAETTLGDAHAGQAPFEGVAVNAVSVSVTVKKSIDAADAT